MNWVRLVSYLLLGAFAVTPFQIEGQLPVARPQGHGAEVRANLGARLRISDALIQQGLSQVSLNAGTQEVRSVHSLTQKVSREIFLHLLTKEKARIEDLELTSYILGSARIGPEDPAYQAAELLGRLLVLSYGCSVITGGGPGIMEAGNRGAREAIELVRAALSIADAAEGIHFLERIVPPDQVQHIVAIIDEIKSIGLNIKLPFEQGGNVYQDEEVSLTFQYLFLRKMMFRLKSRGGFAFKGGIGTLDEIFEFLNELPLVLVNVDFSYQGLITFLTQWWKEGLLEEPLPGYFKSVESAEEGLTHLHPFLDGEKALWETKDFRQVMYELVEELDSALVKLKGLGPALTILGGENYHPGSSVWQTAHELARQEIARGISVIRKDNGKSPGAGIAGAIAAAYERSRTVSGKPHVSGPGRYVSMRMQTNTGTDHLADDVERFAYKEALRVALFRNTSKGFVVFEGGRDTLNLLFEAWCLFKVEKIEPFPIILVGKRWKDMLIEWMRQEMVSKGTIDEDYLDEVQIVEVETAGGAEFDVQKTVEEIITRLRVGNISCDLARDLREISGLAVEAPYDENVSAGSYHSQIYSAISESRIRDHIFKQIDQKRFSLEELEEFMEYRWRKKRGVQDCNNRIKIKLKSNRLLNAAEQVEWEFILRHIAGITQEDVIAQFFSLGRLRSPLVPVEPAEHPNVPSLVAAITASI